MLREAVPASAITLVIVCLVNCTVGNTTEKGEYMNRKKALDLILSKVDEDKKEAFVQELRSAKSKEERMTVIRKYGVTLTKEETDALKASKGNAVSDEELDKVAGGCSCAYVHCECTGCV